MTTILSRTQDFAAEVERELHVAHRALRLLHRPRPGRWVCDRPNTDVPCADPVRVVGVVVLADADEERVWWCCRRHLDAAHEAGQAVSRWEG